MTPRLTSSGSSRTGWPGLGATAAEALRGAQLVLGARASSTCCRPPRRGAARGVAEPDDAARAGRSPPTSVRAIRRSRRPCTRERLSYAARRRRDARPGSSTPRACGCSRRRRRTAWPARGSAGRSTRCRSSASSPTPTMIRCRHSRAAARSSTSPGQPGRATSPSGCATPGSAAPSSRCSRGSAPYRRTCRHDDRRRLDDDLDPLSPRRGRPARRAGRGRSRRVWIRPPRPAPRTGPRPALADPRLRSTVHGLPDETYGGDGQLTRAGGARPSPSPRSRPARGRCSGMSGQGRHDRDRECRAAPSARAFAIERRADRCASIAANARALGGAGVRGR